MNVYDLIEALSELENKEMEVIVFDGEGWRGMCGIDSGVCTVEDEQFFVINPCYGHGDEQQVITRELKADDFEEPPKN